MDNTVYIGLTPHELWRHFGALNRIPRPPGREDAAREYVRRVAEYRGLKSIVDKAGNLLVYVPATDQVNTNAKVVAIQSHLDMVCEKTAGVEHDFDVDPIQPRRIGDRIFGTGTTLGADDGVGVAAALSVVTTSGLRHGPLELIFTVEEETGLYGAAGLETSLLSSRLLLNLDSEDPDGLTVGSAGGATMIISIDASREKVAPRWVGRELCVSGLKGGHSGVQIHERLANAIKLLTDTLTAATSAGIEFRIGSLQGGTADNAIPRQCQAQLAMSQRSATEFDVFIREQQDAVVSAWNTAEPSVLVSSSSCSAARSAYSRDFGQNILALLMELPHGALEMSSAFPGNVETSSNLASVRTISDGVRITISARSLVEAQLNALFRRICKRAQRVEARVETFDRYPSWQPNLGSPLLNLADKVFRRLRGKAPAIQVVHGGLECGFIVSKLPEMDALSFGPLVRFAHTPGEYVAISSVESMWQMLVQMLKALSEACPCEVGHSSGKFTVSAMT